MVIFLPDVKCNDWFISDQTCKSKMSEKDKSNKAKKRATKESLSTLLGPGGKESQGLTA